MLQEQPKVVDYCFKIWRYQPKFWAHTEGLYRGYAESFSLWEKKKSGQSYKTANSIPEKGKRSSFAMDFVSICSFYIQLKFYEFTFQRSTCFPSQKSQSSFLAHTHIGTTCQSSGVIIVGVLPFGERCVHTADSVKAVIWLVQARIMVCFYSSSYFSLVAIFCCLSGALDACCVFLPVKLASRKNA